MLVFEDESGFYLLPGVVKTYAPEGLTPVLREKQTRDHLSVMGAMTPEGRVYTLVRPESLNGLHCIEFLLHLLRVAGERLLVDLGRLADPSAGGGQGVRGEHAGPDLAGGPAGIRPGPEPLGRRGVASPEGCRDAQPVCRDLEELHQELDLAVGRLRQKPHLVRSFFAQAGLKL